MESLPYELLAGILHASIEDMPTNCGIKRIYWLNTTCKKFRLAISSDLMAHLLVPYDYMDMYMEKYKTVAGAVSSYYAPVKINCMYHHKNIMTCGSVAIKIMNYYTIHVLTQYVTFAVFAIRSAGEYNTQVTTLGLTRLPNEKLNIIDLHEMQIRATVDDVNSQLNISISRCENN